MEAGTGAMKPLERVVLVGAGGLGTGLIPALYTAGCEVVALAGRSERALQAWSSAWTAGGRPKPHHVTDLSEAPQNVDAYLLAVPDKALESVASLLPSSIPRIHFAGSGPDTLPGGATAAVWPVQSFPKGQIRNWSEIHAVVSSADGAWAEAAADWTRQFAASATVVKQEQRWRAHIAAVFAANYTNRMFAHAQELAGQSGVPWSAFAPLVGSVCAHAAAGASAAHQTGPAQRGDAPTLRLHLDLLLDQPALHALYSACAADLIPNSSDESTR
jgi:predicted short-subunit dehydrogenase-like oxidoreductase (DUF2520 family)